MFDPEHLSAIPGNLRSLRAAHRDQDDNLHRLNELLEAIKLRFARLDTRLADFQASLAGLGQEKAELPISRRTVRPARPPRLPLLPRRSELPAALAGQNSYHVSSTVR